MRRQARTPLSLAVLFGADSGRILKTGRRRISVGSDPSNDLVLTDAKVAPRHVEILSDGQNWKARAVGDDRIVVDRGWRHPDSGETGARIYLGRSQLLIFTGELEPHHLGLPAQPAEADTGALDNRARGGDVATKDLPDTHRRPAVSAPRGQIGAQDTTGPMTPAPRPVQRPDTGTPTVGVFLSAADTTAEPYPGLTIEAPAFEPEGEEPSTVRGLQRQLVVGVPAEETIADVAAFVRPGSEETRLAMPDEQFVGDPTPAGPLLELPPVVEGVLESGETRAMSVISRPNDDSAWREGGRTPALPPPTYARATWLKDNDPKQPQAKATPETPATARSPHRKRSVSERFDNSRRQLTKAILHNLASDPALSIVREPDGEYSAKIRLLGTRVEQLARSHAYKSYMITSAEPLTGKTTAACNLAFALAENPMRRIALIEANFRSPSFANIFSTPTCPGLRGVLTENAEIQDAIIKVADRNLVIFPSGGTHENPAELLASPGLKNLLQELSESVDIAIIDAPSVHPHADTNLLLPMVDVALLVVRELGTKTVELDRAVCQLGADRVAGAIYNRIDRRLHRNLSRARKRS